MIKQKISHSNRGKALQNAINSTNVMYRIKGWAQIDEIPTPTQNFNGRIKYIAKSTVDYVGISHGRGIAFDAKSTRETSRYDLKNVHAHQVEYLKRFRDQGGIVFFIIEFAKLHKKFFVPFDIFEEYWLESLNGGRKSIPIEALEFHCPEIKATRGVSIDYLIHCERERKHDKTID